MGKTAPLFSRPFGPSQNGSYNGRFWNLENFGTAGSIYCQLCGTQHPENRDESYILFHFMGHQGIEQCCGGLIDEMYRMGSEEFATTYLKAYAKNPGDPQFLVFRDIVQEAVKTAHQNAQKVAKRTEATKALASKAQ